MKNLLIKIIVAAIASSLYGQNKGFGYMPDLESMRNHCEVAEWIRDAKFGIFLR